MPACKCRCGDGVPDLFSSDYFSIQLGFGWFLLFAALIVCLKWRAIIALFTSASAFSVTPKVSRWLSHLVGTRDLTMDEFLRADGASDQYVDKRRSGLARLASRLSADGTRSAEWGKRVEHSMSDLRFADANRVPFPFAKVIRETFNLASVAQHTEGPYLVDLDGNKALDVSGSYGVNVAGYEAYKKWQTDGLAKVSDLGPVLGPLHPLVADNIARLQQISGLDEVSFHTSGTEAVMAAVRLARFNTRREKIVTFAGAYHGWWDGVQPGIGSERSIGDCLTLNEMNPASLRAIRARKGEIAGILINPVQSFHPNSPPPNDVSLMNSSMRQTQALADPEQSDYAQWLRQLRQLCDDTGIPLIFDEVYSGFRLAPGGAQEYFGVKADMVLYGKTVAAGLPIGVVCGKPELMRRFDPQHPMRIAYVVGTFAAYPAAMGTMNEFLNWVQSEAAITRYRTAEQDTAGWVADANMRFASAALPLRISHLGTIWTLEFEQASRFNWLLQYYMRAEGISLSWVGTGRCLISLDFTQAEFADLTERLMRAALCMREDCWWLSEQEQPDINKMTQRGVVKDLVNSMVPSGLRHFYHEVMRRKHDDHVASHSDRTNQFLHLVSSSVFIYCYWLIFSDLVTAMWLGLGALFLRQMGHALIEPPCHDAEQLLLGFDTRTKTVILSIYMAIPVVNMMIVPELTWATLLSVVGPAVAVQWFYFTGLVILGRVLLLVRRHGFYNAMVWFIKLITDPLTDIKAYYASVPILSGLRNKTAS